MRDLQRIIRLSATLLFGLLVLALLLLVSGQMAVHYFRAAAERSIRLAFNEGVQTPDGVRYQVSCREPGSDRDRSWECDPSAVKAGRSLRSASCSGQGFRRFFGRQWRCVAKFSDGATLRVDVSLGPGRRHLEVVLPFREPNR